MVLQYLSFNSLTNRKKWILCDKYVIFASFVKNPVVIYLVTRYNKLTQKDIMQGGMNMKRFMRALGMAMVITCLIGIMVLPICGTAATYKKVTIKELTTEIKKINSTVNQIKPAGSYADRVAQYEALEDDLERIDDRIDAYEEYIEDRYQRGKLSRTDYRRKDRRAEQLEDKLDRIEDKLERILGIDD
jgi:hypothetical protein